MRGGVGLVILFIARLLRALLRGGATGLRRGGRGISAEALKRLLAAGGRGAISRGARLCGLLCGGSYILIVGSFSALAEAEARGGDIVVLVRAVLLRLGVGCTLARGLCGGGIALGGAFFLEADVQRLAVGVLIIVLVELVLLVVLALAAEDDIHDEQQREHRDEYIRDIEHGEIEEVDLEHIDNIAVEHAVKAVRETSGRHQHEAPAPETPVDEVRGKGDDNGDGEHGGENNEVDARTAAGKEAESGAVIVEPDKAENTGYERLSNRADHEIGRDPVLYPLVKDNDQDTDNSIKHIFLLSAADRSQRHAKFAPGAYLKSRA